MDAPLSDYSIFEQLAVIGFLLAEGVKHYDFH
jgi:hypothetical protein